MKGEEIMVGEGKRDGRIRLDGRREKGWEGIGRKERKGKEKKNGRKGKGARKS
jgi:hypothetical protein